MAKPIMVHNTLNNTKMEFKPLEEGKVKMYVCGLTYKKRIINIISQGRPYIGPFFVCYP